MDWIKSVIVKLISDESIETELSQWCTDEDFSFWRTNNDAYNLLIKDFEPVIGDVKLEDIIEKSDTFPVDFPIQSVRCKELQKQISREILETYTNSAYPVIHEKVLQIIAQWLLYKRGPGGSKIENELYKEIDIPGLIDRFLLKKAVMFVGPRDVYSLLDGLRGEGGWDTIGTDEEKPPLVLEHCISYDEMWISAFLSVSSFTHYVNVGNRHNVGIYSEDRTDIEDEGIIVGLIGPRFQRHNLLDYADIIHDGEEKKKKNIFLEMYGKEETNVKYKPIGENPVVFNNSIVYKKLSFDNVTYAKRIALSFDTFLHEANARAKERGTSAFVHVVGIGLGAWKLSAHQEPLFMDICANRIEYLGKYLSNVSDVYFAYIKVFAANKYKDGDVIPVEGHPKGGIKIHVGLREPHAKLTGENEGKLLVVSYAWNSNAQPGNDFWLGSLASSGDPAAACSTQIAELHNAYINPKVCGKNLRVVTSNGVLTFREYQEKVKIEIEKS